MALAESASTKMVEMTANDRNNTLLCKVTLMIGYSRKTNHKSVSSLFKHGLSNTIPQGQKHQTCRWS